MDLGGFRFRETGRRKERITGQFEMQKIKG
jgi:hypothetical protein